MTHLDRRLFIGAGTLGLLGATSFARGNAAPGGGAFAAPTGASDDQLFAAARREFLFPSDVTYCNTGTLGASPRQVVDALVDGVTRLEAGLPDWPYYQADGEPLTGYQELRSLRGDIAAFVNADVDEIALTQNATMGMSFIAGGLKMRPGDEVLTTDQEHSGGIGGWRLRARRSGITVRELPLDQALEDGEDGVVRLFENAITPNTRVIMFSQITSQLGIVLPARRLCELAHAHRLLAIVDGAQVVGQTPVDLAAMGCDAFVASPHKWMLAPKGTGFMFVRRELQDDIWSTLASSKFEDYDAGAFRFMQYGTGSVPVTEGLRSAIDFMKTLDVARVGRWNRANNLRLRRGLAGIRGARLASPEAEEFAGAVTTFRVEGRGARELQDALWERERIRVRAQGDDKGVRLCCHLYVAPADIDRALEVVASLA